ncbi:hypothetical protein AVEN_259889-1, partial [Araneus ventricosus]
MHLNDSPATSRTRAGLAVPLLERKFDLSVFVAAEESLDLTVNCGSYHL